MGLSPTSDTRPAADPAAICLWVPGIKPGCGGELEVVGVVYKRITGVYSTAPISVETGAILL